MMRRRRGVFAGFLSACSLLALLSGCHQAGQVSTFVQDFAREALAAFLL